MAARHRHRASGGSMKGRMDYTSKSNVAPEAGDMKDSFRKGGRKHHGLHAHGGKSHPRADKRARGGSVTHSPFSSAARGNDTGRFPKDKDGHQPRATGGQVFARGGRAKRHAGIGHSSGGKSRPSPSNKHEYNFGHHEGSGHEEPLQRVHPPVHHKHGGPEKGYARGGRAHHAGHGGHLAHHPHHDGHHHGHHGAHGSHKAMGKKHRAHGGKVDKEDD